MKLHVRIKCFEILEKLVMNGEDCDGLFSCFLSSAVVLPPPLALGATSARGCLEANQMASELGARKWETLAKYPHLERQ